MKNTNQINAPYGASLKPMQMEIGTGEPGYRWIQGFTIVTPDGAELFPPMPEKEARALCKQEGWPVLGVIRQ